MRPILSRRWGCALLPSCAGEPVMWLMYLSKYMVSLGATRQPC